MKFFISKQSCRLTPLLGALCFSLAFWVSLARAGSENDRAMLAKQLLTERDHFAREPMKNLDFLVSIGIAQIKVKDQKEAQKTLAIVAAGNPRDICEFVGCLAALQARMGDFEKALVTVSSIRWKSWHFSHCQALLAVARGAADAGFKTGATKAIARAIGVAEHIQDHAVRHSIMCDIGMTQIALGLSVDARKTLGVLEDLIPKINTNEQSLARALCSMGCLCEKLPDHPSATKYFAEAVRAIDVKSLGGGVAHEMIAVAQAEAHDVVGAIQVAQSIPETFPLSANRTKALYGIAMIQISRNDCLGAEKTASQIRQFLNYRSLILIAIAKSYAHSGKTMKAIAVADRIKGDSRKAQAMLEIATIVAQRGDKKTAWKIADGLNYPQAHDPFIGSTSSGPRFVFRDSKTWGVHYEPTGGFTMASLQHGKETANDLTAAAMRCRVALEGNGIGIDRKILNRWDVRSIANVQSANGDAIGALTWAEYLSGLQRLSALLGVADGLAVLEETKGKQ
jgi:hypothetical protein